MKIWVDDVRPAPEGQGYVTVKSVNLAKSLITTWESKCTSLDSNDRDEMLEVFGSTIELIDLDHDAGEYASNGGDYIEILNWLERTGRNYPIRIHSMNPVGRGNMRAIIRKNGWKEID